MFREEFGPRHLIQWRMSGGVVNIMVTCAEAFIDGAGGLLRYTSRADAKPFDRPAFGSAVRHPFVSPIEMTPAISGIDVLRSCCCPLMSEYVHLPIEENGFGGSKSRRFSLAKSTLNDQFWDWTRNYLRLHASDDLASSAECCRFAGRRLAYLPSF
jgi:hypothetical protein